MIKYKHPQKRLKKVLFIDIYALGDILIFIFIEIFLAFFIPLAIIRYRRKKFVLAHSVAIKELNRINEACKFKEIPNFDMEHDYDNEQFYENISCHDYLTYQLVYLRKQIANAANDSLENELTYKRYKKAIVEKCKVGNYNAEIDEKKREKLESIEEKLLKKKEKTPVDPFTVKVTLYLTNINGYWREKKKAVFSIEDIREIILKLKDKTNNGFYRDQQTWDAICRVERGKVSNKMRFSIYRRDGYRCCKCHRRTDDLEIDHIIPISKGGKSTYENLQTLCHRCNVVKGSNIEN